MRAHIEATARATAEEGLQSWQTRLHDVGDQTLTSTADEVRARVEESAQATADSALRTWQAKFQEFADQTAAAKTGEVQRQSDEALAAMGPKLQELQERAVNDAVEAFRGRLSQFLGMFPAGGNK